MSPSLYLIGAALLVAALGWSIYVMVKTLVQEWEKIARALKGGENL